MAVRLYGGTSADFLADAAGNWDGGGAYSVFADRALTTNITSTVTDKTGAPFPSGQPVADAVGLVEFTLPDSHTDFVWVATFDTVSEVWREPVRVAPADIPTRVATVETALPGKADLVGGVVPTSQLPALAINDTFPVASQAAMLALTAQRGDVAIRTDLSPAEAFILAADDPTTLGNWKQITADAATLAAAQTYADSGDAARLAKASNLSDVANAGTALANLGGISTSAANAAFVPQAESPYRLVDTAMTVRTDTTTQPRPFDAIGSVLYGATDGGGLYKTTDHGVSWTLVQQVGAGSAINGIRLMPDGEVLLLRRNDGIYRSSGWAANPGTATWTLVRAPSSGAWFLPWGFDTAGNLCIVVEYAIPRSNSHGCWVSTDGGLTWTQRLDLKVMYPLPVDPDSTHWHGATIDTFASPTRLWVTHGDGIHGIYYSDDLGVTWTLLSSAYQSTTPVAAEHGIIAGTDEVVPDGLIFIERRTPASSMAVENLYYARYPSGGLAYQSQRSVRTAGGLVLSGASPQPNGAPALLLASPDGGRSAYEIYRWTPAAATSTTLSTVVVDSAGWVYVWMNLDGLDQWFRGRLELRPGFIPKDPGGVFGGTTLTDKNSVAVGGTSTAAGQATAVGVGANGGTDRGVALGYLSSATGSRGVAVGESTVASNTQDTAVGEFASSSGTQGVAVGSKSSSASAASTAIGYQASTAHQRSVALGSNTATTAADQVHIAGRHLAMTELAADPAVPAADNARLYALDDGSGATRFKYRTTSGIYVVATKAEVDAETTRATAAESNLQTQINNGIVYSAEQHFTAVDIDGLTGAVTPTRYVGGTTGGPPTTGTFAAGDFVVTTNGNMWICTTAGSPGTWIPVGSNGFVARTTDATGVVSSTTLVDDDVLTRPVTAGATYEINLALFYDASTAGDVKFALRLTSGTATLLRFGQIGIQSGATTANNVSVRMDTVSTSGGSSGSIAGLGTGTAALWSARGILISPSVNANLVVQYAQSTSDATATRLLAGSWMSMPRRA